MNTTEKILFALALFIGGVAVGMYYEHQRFIKEVQGLREQHKAPGPPPPAPDPEGATA
jgi:hypothetical protein